MRVAPGACGRGGPTSTCAACVSVIVVAGYGPAAEWGIAADRLGLPVCRLGAGRGEFSSFTTGGPGRLAMRSAQIEIAVSSGVRALVVDGAVAVA